MNIISVENLELKNDILNYPSGICFNSSDKHLYITDMHNHRICRYSLDDQQLQALPNAIHSDSEVSTLDKPLALSVFDDRQLIVADAGLNMLYRTFVDDVNWIPVLPRTNGEDALNLPGGVATDGQGNVYVNDFLNNRICKITHGEMTVIIGGEYGFEDGNFENAKINKPYGLFYRNERIYFVDTENNAVRFIDLAHKTVGTLKPDKEGIELIRPSALTLDPEGNIYICEQRRLHCINIHTNRLFTILDKTIWKELQPKFALSQRICHIGAAVVPEKGNIYWIDTIKGLLYNVRINF